MLLTFWSLLQRKITARFQTLHQRLKTWIKPLPVLVTVGALADLPRSKSDLLLENAFLRHQLAVLQRQVKRPHFTWKDRLFMIVMASRLRSWRQTLLLVQPDTLLRLAS